MRRKSDEGGEDVEGVHKDDEEHKGGAEGDGRDRSTKYHGDSGGKDDRGEAGDEPRQSVVEWLD